MTNVICIKSAVKIMTGKHIVNIIKKTPGTPFAALNYEISGICNGKCPYCDSGCAPVYEGAPFLKAADFEKGIDRLLSLGLIDTSTCVELFISGEPALNPDLGKIAGALARRKIHYSISTNASRAIELPPEHVKYLKVLTFSMSGFSQESYDRIHGLRFKNVIANITKTLDNLFGKELWLYRRFMHSVNCSFHVYQFNIQEMAEAARFCGRNGIAFQPCEAFFNGVPDTIAYLRKELPAGRLYQASRDLLVYYLDKLLKEQPPDYQCPQWNMLSVDEKSNILVCCGGFPRNYPGTIVGSMFDLTADEILDKKRHMPVCGPCTGSGAAFWQHHRHTPAFIGRSLNLNKDIVNRLGRLLPEKLRSAAKKYFRRKMQGA